MKTIGILGGVGPQATMNFEEHIHLASQQLIPPLFNSGYPPVIVFYHRYAPVQIIAEGWFCCGLHRNDIICH
jgi:aspartate racemase